ncbi:tetratricopeptide repeat protein 12-like [Pollicipes pollicipes]|uniref:tetratricopeptide repeat protein 12-like n=1 Tax=Pollicipes pollicipes TaxID=41117 RepID=UPI001884CF15|nr:tetratricopeptide repeat protein 12-like [Pollicipes pollicipes]
MAVNEELDSFLTRVDQVSSLIEALRSPDPEKVQRATERADLLVRGRLAEGAVDEHVECTVAAENRCSVNPRPALPPEAAQQEDFKRQLEADAAERAENRRQAKAESAVWKEKAIQAFREGKYEEALDEYTKALALLKDSCLLYTSRAQTYLKLNRASEALQDLDWALRLDETSLRAWIHKGKAHQQLGQLQLAVQSFEKAIKLHPDNADVVRVYIRDIERARERNAKPADEMHY